MREIDPAEAGHGIYPHLTALVVPRPIAWVSTVSSAGVGNLAPHSFFTVAAVYPAVLQFTSVGVKDSLRNVRETGEFVVHIVSRQLAEVCNATATDYPRQQGEYDALSLPTVPSHVVGVPRLAAATVAFECRSVGEKTFGDSTVVFGEVVWLSVAEEVLADDGYADLRALDPVSRLGRNDWGTVGEVFALRRVPFSELSS